MPSIRDRRGAGPVASSPAVTAAAVMASRTVWTSWQPLDASWRISPIVLAEVLDGGQSFRWWRQADGSWLGQWHTTIVGLRHDSRGIVEWRATSPAVTASPTATGARGDTVQALRHYLNLGPTHEQAIDGLPWRSDPHLARCLERFPDLRLLHQPFGETLLAFLCSATKQIVQIKQMLALLAGRLGQPCAGIAGSAEAENAWPGAIGWRLPTWDEVARVSESDLRDCLLGFRARYIHATAQFLASAPGWLDETERLPYGEAKARLCTLPGVGEKVADCVLLFGAGKGEAFPVDVWILKAMARRYGLTTWAPAQVAQFGRIHFGAQAGLAQQYLFAFERAEGRRDPDPAS
jgi:N-glycosylase/DNA lyase